MNGTKKEETLGQILKEKRLEKGLTLEDVYRKTKIPLSFLETIEADQLPEISSVYIKGLLKIYCNFLGLDYYDLLKKFNYLESQGMKKESVIFGSQQIKFKRYKIPYIKITLISLIVIISILGLSKLKSNTQKIAKSTLKETPQQRPQTTLPKALEWPKEKPPLVSNPKIIKVRLKAKQDCWVKAIVDGKVVFQSILKKGSFEVWEAKDNVELSLGNAGGVELYINEKPFSTLGKAGQMIRKLIINQEGLQILR
jgi:cytoskeletal protein RodZ